MYVNKINDLKNYFVINNSYDIFKYLRDRDNLI